MHKPNWGAIRAHYEEIWPEIMAQAKNEWAVDPYHWADVVKMTPIEEWMWGSIRDVNAIFYPQFPTGGFFLDFANPVAKVAIECDGAAYHLDYEKDFERDKALAASGWRVYRVTGSACYQTGYPEIGRLGDGDLQLRMIVSTHRITRNDAMQDACIRSIRLHEQSFTSNEAA